MDLNYILHRQQVELMRADAAACAASGRAHREMAERYTAIARAKKAVAKFGAA